MTSNILVIQATRPHANEIDYTFLSGMELPIDAYIVKGCYVEDLPGSSRISNVGVITCQDVPRYSR